MGNFIFQIDKIELEDHIELNIYSQDPQNNTILQKTKVLYEILTKKEDFEAINIKTDKIILSDEVFYNKKGEKVIKITIKNKELHEYILKQLREAEFETYEADLIEEHKYLINNNIKIFEGDKSPDNEPKYLSIDIETVGSYENMEIIMISTYSPSHPEQNKVIANKSKIKTNKYDFNTKKKEKYQLILANDELEMLEIFIKNIFIFKPQIILGWNVIDFDFKVIKERMKFHNIPFKFNDFHGECKLRINKDFFRESTLYIPGILVFDVIQLLKSNFISFDDYKLNTVAKQVLSDEKIDLNNKEEEEEESEDKMKAIESLAASNPLKLADYNFKDSVLTSQIVEKLKLLNLMVQRSIITNTPLLKVKSPIAALDIMYLTELHKKQLVAPSNFNYNDSAQIEGAYVINPQKGFYEDIFVFDFKSLYPSIIMTFNIDPFTYGENGQISAPNGAKFDKKRGILPELILKLYKERDVAKKENDKIKSHALKITMNSFYGAMASPKSRFHNREVGGAITAFARHITKKAQKYIEKLGHTVIYGDTDSIFVKFSENGFKDFNDKKLFGFKIEKELNQYFNKWVKEEFGQENFLTIEFEKLYSKFFIASKKRYVGYDEFTKETRFTGMEAIRGDWTELAKQFQTQLVELMFSGKKKESIIKFINDFIKELESGKFDNLLVYNKKITKPLASYTKTTPPHVKAAREVDNFKGRLVKYVMGKDGPRHLSLVDKNFKFDYKHYIEKQLGGVSDDLLEAFGINFNEINGMRKQTSLNKFF